MPPVPRSPAPAGSPVAADDGAAPGDLPLGLAPMAPPVESAGSGGIPITPPARSTFPCEVSTIHEPDEPGPAGGPMPGGIPPPRPGILPGTGPPLNTGSVAGGDALAAGEGPEPAGTSGGTGGVVGVRTDRPPAGEPPPGHPGGSPPPGGG